MTVDNISENIRSIIEAELEAERADQDEEARCSSLERVGERWEQFRAVVEEVSGLPKEDIPGGIMDDISVILDDIYISNIDELQAEGQRIEAEEQRQSEGRQIAEHQAHLRAVLDGLSTQLGLQ